MPNLQVIAPSRKRRKLGEIFVMQFSDMGYLFGRVVSLTGKWTLAAGANPAPIIYVYTGLHDSKDADFNGAPSNLLIPPVFINSLPWTRGYFETIRVEPITPEILLRHHHFYNPAKSRYYDDNGQEILRPAAPVGTYALDSFLTVDDAISDALGVPRAP